MLDTVATVATVIGLPLTLAGLYFTWRQVRQATSIVQATQSAVTATQAQLRHNHLLVLLPQLPEIERDIERSVYLNNTELVIHHLSVWRRSASQMRGLLVSTGWTDEGLLVAIQESIAMAADAKLTLQSSTKPLATVTKRAQARISIVTNATGTLAGTLAGQAEVGSS